jgi:hypothetical protein
MANGELTARIARRLSQKLELRGFDILFDHGDRQTDPPDKLGEIVSWFGHKLRLDARLALLDIAVVSRDSDKAFALIEIEESSATPKVLLGDVLATLLGDKVTFQHDRDLKVGQWTTLIVLTRADKRGSKESLVAFLEDRLNRLRYALSTPNASIDRIVVATFGDESELEAKLTQAVKEALPK